jgi:hypothetical protein
MRGLSSLAGSFAALALLVLASTGHRFANGFVFDDDAVIRDGTLIHDPSRLAEVWTHHTMVASASDPGAVQSVDTYRPITLTLFFADALLSGRHPAGYHVTNLLLHVGCTLLVFALALTWLGRDRRAPAFYGAAVFAVHPWSVEAHVWINGRSDPLALLFGLSAMLVLLRSERAGAAGMRAATGAGVLFLAGLLSKETLLLVAPAVIVMPPAQSAAGAPFRRLALRRAMAVLGASAIYLAVRAVVLGGMRTHRDADMLAEAALRLPWLLADSLRHALAPGLPYLRSLRDEYAGVGIAHALVAATIVLAVALLAWVLRRRRPVLAWSALFFFPPLLPVAILTTVLWPGFGRYLYLPMAGLAWALASAGAWLGEHIRRPAMTRVLAGTHVVALALVAALFTRDFADGERLYAAAIEARPDVAMGYGWLGMERLDRGDAAGALALLERAAELDPETHRYLAHAGRAALEAGDPTRAARIAELGIERFGGQPEEASYRLLAVNAMTERSPERATMHLARCLERAPSRRDCERALMFLVRDAPDASENRAALERVIETSDAALAARLRGLLE